MAKEDIMGNEFSGDWESFITWEIRNGEIVTDPFPEDDGKIQVVSHTPTSVNGRHVDAGGTQQSMDDFQFFSLDTAGRRFRLKYRRNDGPTRERRQYAGELTIVNPATGKKIVRGRVVVLGGGPEPGDTGTWEAGRPGGGGLFGGGKGGGGGEGGEQATQQRQS
ncbi:MAG TPA: hypothetical protein VG148_17300 [Pyrinomonadaceae bacterium]|nr:hypothetical protein [Pyrinomonadaceae bacterium]